MFRIMMKVSRFPEPENPGNPDFHTQLYSPFKQVAQLDIYKMKT